MEAKLIYLKEKLEGFPRKPLSLTPTPCHRLDYLSNTYQAEVYCKRDDMTGFGFGGNKSRKLEFLIGEALSKGCDTLVTSGGIQSNFCRLTAAAGSVAGMEVHLILGGGIETEPTGNVLLDEMLGAKIYYVSSTDWDDWENESKRVTAKLVEEGRKVFRMPIGGSVPIGAAGYVNVFLEIMNDQNELGVAFDHIIHATSSGGTQAGLVVGKAMTDWPGRISGIAVTADKQSLEKTALDLSIQTAGLLGGQVDPESIIVDDRYIGDGYALRTSGAERAIEIFARREGIFLDHVYTGKAASALMDWLEKGKLKNQRVLFLHTGGQVELFAN
ncbi:1-aminocyclopropane-1-carboxylate deaminase/D-cysteine desulfhydrase [Thermodesulfobacteriota bacterium]